jgi:hypothetical protein
MSALLEKDDRDQYTQIGGYRAQLHYRKPVTFRHRGPPPRRRS